MEAKTKKETKLIIISSVVAIPVLIFFGIIYYDLFDLALQPEKPVFASVNGDEIKFLDYINILQKGMDDFENTNKKELTENKIKEMKEQLFDFLIEQKIYEQNIKKNNIEVKDKEVEYVMYKNPGSLPDNVKSIFADSNGVFREDLYLKGMNIDSPENNKFKESLKYAVKKMLETKKLFDIITRDIKLTGEEMTLIKNSDESNKLLVKKQNNEMQKWIKEMKSKAVIVDNRKYFDDKIQQN